MSMSPALTSGVGAFFGIARVEFQPPIFAVSSVRMFNATSTASGCPYRGCSVGPAPGRVWLGHVDQSGRGPYHSIPLSPRARPPSPCARRLPRGSTKAWGRVLRVRSSSVGVIYIPAWGCVARLSIGSKLAWLSWNHRASNGKLSGEVKLRARLEMLETQSPWARLKARLEMLGIESPWARLRARLEMLGTEPLSEVESSLGDAQD
ncbi:hypothetical protein BHE74_00054489 [Ensete ventricosum]|nr:hypothetical protein BHE74_00054489 [Ensete ventricosum]